MLKVTDTLALVLKRTGGSGEVLVAAVFAVVRAAELVGVDDIVDLRIVHLQGLAGGGKTQPPSATNWMPVTAMVPYLASAAAKVS